MGRRRRESGHLQGRFPLQKVAPKQRTLSSSQPSSAGVAQNPFANANHLAVPPAYHQYREATDLLSPVSSRSGLSYGGVVHSTTTGYTNALAEGRHLSPGPATPTCSTVSTRQSFHHPDQASGRLLQYPGATTSNPPDPDVLMKEDVIGIDVRVSHDEAQQYLRTPQYVSQRGLSPTDQQRFPSTSGPWNPFNFRHDNPFLRMDDVSPTATDVPQDTAHMPGTRKKGGGRKGPMPVVARRQTCAVRKLGACLRCRLTREKCDDTPSCRNCSNKDRRKFPRSCIRPHFDWDSCKASLFPYELTCRLRNGSLFPFLNHASSPLPTRQKFEIALDINVWRPIRVEVIEVCPLTLAPHIRHAFRFIGDGAGNTTYARHQVWSPPINVWIKYGNLPSQIALVRKQISVLFDQTLGHPQRWKDWTMKFFPNKQEDFPTSILDFIGEYYREDIEEHAIIKTALSLLWFQYFLVTKFQIPAEEVPHLEAKLESERPPGASQDIRVIPDTINRFIKGVILPQAEVAAEKLTKTLHETMFSMALHQELSPGRTDRVLCLAFVLLIFLGRNQTALLLLAESPADEIGMGYSAIDAEAKIREIEHSIADYTVSFHKYTLSRKSSNPGMGTADQDSACEVHAREFNLVDRLRSEVKEFYAGEKPKSLDVPELELKTFRYVNVRRLCWKLFHNVEYDGLN